MEKEKIVIEVQNQLKRFNMDMFDQYKENTQEQFITIEQYFLETEERLNQAIKEIKSVSFNIRGICKATDISKSTVYNNPNTLRLYIERRIEEHEKQDILSKNKQEKTQERTHELENFLDRAIIDHIEFNNLKMKNENLTLEISSLTEKNHLLALERIELIKKMNEQDAELRKLRSKKGNTIALKNHY